MKIYNEIVIDMNPESSSYGKALYEDSFEYSGDLILMQDPVEIDDNVLDFGLIPGGLTLDLSDNPYTQNIIPTGTDLIDPEGKLDAKCKVHTDCPPGETCQNGSCQKSDAVDDTFGTWDLAESGIGTEGWDLPEWYDDPETAEDEYGTYLYEEIAGGFDKTKMTKEDWLADYRGDFPEWEGSDEFLDYQKILRDMGLKEKEKELATESYGISKEALALKQTATGEIATEKGKELAFGIESQFLGGGGGISGRKISRTEQAFADVNRDLSLELTGIDLDRDLLDITYEGELLLIEDQLIKYDDALVATEEIYEDNLKTLYQTGIETAKEGEDPWSSLEDCDESDDCGEGFKCVGQLCMPETEEVGTETLKNTIANIADTGGYIAEYDFNEDGVIDQADLDVATESGEALLSGFMYKIGNPAENIPRLSKLVWKRNEGWNPDIVRWQKSPLGGYTAYDKDGNVVAPGVQVPYEAIKGDWQGSISEEEVGVATYGEGGG